LEFGLYNKYSNRYLLLPQDYGPLYKHKVSSSFARIEAPGSPTRSSEKNAPARRVILRSRRCANNACARGVSKDDDAIVSSSSRCYRKRFRPSYVTRERERERELRVTICYSYTEKKRFPCNRLRSKDGLIMLP